MFNEQLNLFINTGNEMSEKLKQAYKMGIEAGKKDEEAFYKGWHTGYAKAKEDLIKLDKIKASFKKHKIQIPALVKYQKIPFWWRLKEQKAKLMGTIIIIKELDEDEIQYVNRLPNTPLCIYSSEREAEEANRPSGVKRKGHWYWSKDDLILYPTKEDVEFQFNLKYMAEGFPT